MKSTFFFIMTFVRGILSLKHKKKLHFSNLLFQKFSCAPILNLYSLSLKLAKVYNLKDAKPGYTIDIYIRGFCCLYGWSFLVKVILCVYVFCLHLCKCTLEQCPRKKPEESIRSPENGDINDWKLPCQC